MAFYAAKDEPAHPAPERAVSRTLSRDQKPRPENTIPPILTVGIGHRFYSPSLGRWLSRDPIGCAGGLNVLAFSENEPTRRLDILGLRAVCCKCDLTKQRDISGDINKQVNQLIQEAGGNVDKLQQATVGRGIVRCRIEDWMERTLHKDLRTTWHKACAPVANVCGKCVGVDKVGHFFEFGYGYLKIVEKYGKQEYAYAVGEWLEGRRPSKEMIAWIKREKPTINVAAGEAFGVNALTFGIMSDGSVMNAARAVGVADLKANRAGLKFYESVKAKGVSYKFDICNFVDDGWDEEKTPNTRFDPWP